MYHLVLFNILQRPFNLPAQQPTQDVQMLQMQMQDVVQNATFCLSKVGKSTRKIGCCPANAFTQVLTSAGHMLNPIFLVAPRVSSGASIFW